MDELFLNETKTVKVKQRDLSQHSTSSDQPQRKLCLMLDFQEIKYNVFTGYI